MTVVRAPKPRVGSPIVFRAVPNGPEFEVRPHSGRCRDLFLAGYIVLSCSKCTKTIKKLDGEVAP